MAADDAPYNPLDYDNHGQSVAEALLARPVMPLPKLAPFGGAGIYVVYYTGGFAPYEPLAARNPDGRFAVPIYVGKAVPSGARKGGRGGGARGAPLFNRLGEHAASIAQAQNLDAQDFACRYLVVEDIWIPLGEALLIERFQPLWIVIVDGFGNHDPGLDRSSGQRPLWDMLHPGRSWADRLRANRRTLPEIIATVQRALAGLPVEPISEEAQREEADSDRG
jgi:hypothetical protein